MGARKTSIGELKKIMRRVIAEQATQYDIIGKTVGEVFEDFNGYRIIADKTIVYAKLFDSSEESFGNIEAASEYLKSEGYDKGSMYMDYPIAFMVKGKTGMDDSGITIITTKHGEERPLVITKYDRLDKSNWDEMDGALLSKDFRNGSVYAVFFNFPD